MLNSVKRDRIFSLMWLSKASNFALIASSDAIVYASRSVILRADSTKSYVPGLNCPCLPSAAVGVALPGRNGKSLLLGTLSLPQHPDSTQKVVLAKAFFTGV
ncbi:hypothetical protein BHM03_00015440 [Ensete ventricosum]|nr:hypothetical protein BHM03_00015440 [Ensete ventricosum]